MAGMKLIALLSALLFVCVCSIAPANNLHVDRTFVGSIKKVSVEEIRGGGRRGGNVEAPKEAPAAPVVVAPVVKSPPGGAPAISPAMAQTMKVGFYFFLWYAFNVVYNIKNKQALNTLPLPYTVACSQLGAGLLYLFPVWLLTPRKTPKLSAEHIKNLSPIAFFHTLGHVATVISLGAGSVSFTHIVKAAEPFFSTVMSAIFLKSIFPIPVYLTLLPIVAGVCLASMTELSFSWVAFLNAMLSNTAFSLRAIFSKKAMGKPQGENMTAANLYAVLTIMSFLGLAPLALFMEFGKFKGAWDEGLAKVGPKALKMDLLLSGIFYYLYNEVAFLALDSVHPITHAVGNTIKRVVIIVASVVFFKTKMRPLSILGSSVAIGGVLLYSLVKQYYPEKKPEPVEGKKEKK